MTDPDPIQEAIELSEEMAVEIRRMKRDIREMKDTPADDDDDGPSPSQNAVA